MHAGLAILAVIPIVFVAWHFASSRQSLPCPVWLRWMVELDNPFTRTNRSAVIIEHLDLGPGMFVLDMSCGPGRLTIPVALKVGEQGRVVAVDIKAGMLRRAEQKAAGAGVDNIEFIQADAGEGVLEKSHFDRALLVAVLGEIPGREVVLREIYEALKPGGILSITEIIFDPHFQRQTTVRKLARQTGFREKAIFGNTIAYTIHLEKPA
ncbi:MAG TPA: methyltransferase domain-containing protein [Gammaproteobacteria bacterium]|nr:methyltransferase domain-containing protein [Gammaproteobacteria bacterium]